MTEVRVTPREFEMLAAYADTGSQKQAAEALGIKTQTLKNALLTARKRCQVNNTAQLLYLLGAGELGELADD